jgi:hypothetical protein
LIEYGEEKHKGSFFLKIGLILAYWGLAFTQLDRDERLEKKKEKRDWRVGAKRTVENYLFQSSVEGTPTETFLMNVEFFFVIGFRQSKMIMKL